jgi:hypothetical protein
LILDFFTKSPVSMAGLFVFSMIDKSMRFKQWIILENPEYLGADALDNDPKNAEKTAFLQLRNEMGEYVDQLSDLKVPQPQARSQTYAAYKDQISQFSPEFQNKLNRWLNFITGMMYPVHSDHEPPHSFT